MSKDIKNKLLPLVIGFAIFSLLVVFAISAWTGPPAAPPDPNAPAPINVSSDEQTKTGNLIVNNLTTAGGNLYLNDSGEGNIWGANWIVGDGDLFLKSNAAENATVYIAGSNISFWSGLVERWNIDSSGSLVKGSVPWGRVVDFTEEDCPLNMAVVGRNLDGSLKCSSSVCAVCSELCLEYDCGEPDLVGGCKPKPVGEQGLSACQQCGGSSLDPEFVPNNSQDIDGLNLCNSACSACQSGVCDPADINTDPGGQCPYDIQYQIGGDPNYCQQRERDGFCDGLGSCNDYSSWQNINENQTCSSNAPHCSGDTYYAGYTCAGGVCNQDYNDIGCCQGSKCPSGSYCRQSDHTCVGLPLCTQRNNVGFGYVNAADDSRCGTIDCDGRNYYYTTGSNGPDVTEKCMYRNYDDITMNRCEGYNNRKDPNTSDCTVYNNQTIADCGRGRYLTGGTCNSGAS